MHRNRQIISARWKLWTPTSRATLTGKLFPSIERCELSINCLRDRGKVNVTPELNSMSQTSIKGSCKQYVKHGSVFTGSQCPEILRSSFCTSEWCFCFSSLCRLKARIMFEVEGETQGRINIYEANVSGNSNFFSFKAILSWYREYIKEDVWVVVVMLMNMWLHWNVCDYQVDFGAVIRYFSGMFFWWRWGQRRIWIHPFPTLPVIHLSLFGPETNSSNDWKIT